MGRADQLDALEEAFAAAREGESRALLVGGEAGIGKSRLVEEFTGRAEKAGARVLSGACLELGSDSLPYAPVAAALRGLVREIGADAVRELSPLGPLARLLPEFGPSEADEEDTSRGRLYEHVLLLLERLAARQPLVLVVEDAHWADRSTRELLVFLTHNLVAVPVLLVVTFRSDELHRKHPLRAVLAELDRARGLERVDLPRLARREVAQQAAGILGGRPDGGLLDAVFARSQGNPLFVEALLRSSNADELEVSDTLRDLLLRRVENLPDETRRVMRVMSAGGVSVPHSLLAAVAEYDDDTLTRALRPAVDDHTIVVDGSDYVFRHALLWEVVHDELLPGEHSRLHQRYAEVLEADESSPRLRRSVELARHWYSAHDMQRALAAAWSAAGEAAKAYAYAERLALLERVLELWDRVEHPADSTGHSRSGVLEYAVEAADRSGELARGVSYATAALAEVADPLRRAALLRRRGNMTRSLGRGTGMDDFKEALRLTAAEPAGATRADVLATLARVAMLRGTDDEAPPLAREALQVARSAGALASEVDALTTLATLTAFRGDIDSALDEYAQARRVAESAGAGVQLIREAVNRMNALSSFGRYEEALAVGAEASSEAGAIGVERASSGTFVDINVVEALVPLGRWDEADEVISSTLDGLPASASAGYLHRWKAEIELARGDPEGTARLVARARALGRDDAQDAQQALPLICLDAKVALARRRPADAVESVEGALGKPFSGSLASNLFWPVLVTGVQALAELRWGAASRAQPTQDIESRLAVLDRFVDAIPMMGPVEVAQRAAYDAERARALGRPDPTLWSAAATAWQRLRQPYPRAYALFREAEERLLAGAADEATPPLRTAFDLASELGAAPLRHEIEALARRGRLVLEPAPDSSGEGKTPEQAASVDGDVQAQNAEAVARRFGLTTREGDVLDLLAAGRSNREIAADLFISPKTASVHVSNILGKLGASSRTEAATIAYRMMPDSSVEL